MKWIFSKGVYFFTIKEEKYYLRINSYQLGMDSERRYTSTQSTRSFKESRVSSEVTTGSQLTPNLFNQFLPSSDSNGDCEETPFCLEDAEEPIATKGLEDYLGKEDAIQDAYDLLSKRAGIKSYTMPTISDTAAAFQKLHQDFLARILDLLFSKREGKKEEKPADEGSDLPTEQGQLVSVATTYCTQSYYMESEFTSFSAHGIVNTDDGRSINVNLDISMSSTFIDFFSTSITSISYMFTDPLVVNLSEAPADLKDLKFFFDLDCDGVEEEISTFASKSAFLALDLNEDGKINDGSELFGALSGDGFADLAKYDSDNNGWIDENDEIFSKLKIWGKDADGNDLIYTLKDKNIGAICLQNADTDHMVRSHATFDPNGRIRKTGVFLYEDGNVGTIQHVDLVS